jgi:hypothetical protein
MISIKSLPDNSGSIHDYVAKDGIVKPQERGKMSQIAAMKESFEKIRPTDMVRQGRCVLCSFSESRIIAD